MSDQADSLTKREREVLVGMAHGKSNKEIADDLHISEHTVKVHITNATWKLSSNSRTEAVMKAIKRKLISLDEINFPTDTTQPANDRFSPRIICAACRDASTNTIFVGARHLDQVMRTQIANAKVYNKAQVEQGFIDQFGTFYSRTEAWRIADKQGQIKFRCGGDSTNGGTLFSENLY